MNTGMVRFAIGMLICIGVSACAGTTTRGSHPGLADSGRGTPTEIFEHGRALSRSGDALRGEQYMVMAVRLGFPERQAIVEIVGACLASARLRAALGHVLPFLRRNPDAWQVRQLVGALHLALGDPTSARAALLQVIEQQPTAAEAHYLLAVIAQDHLIGEATVEEHFASYLAHAPEGRHAAEARAWIARSSR